MNKPLRVMKFGGTSVGDASCIARAAQIIAQASREASLVMVVSVMSSVTNRPVKAATRPVSLPRCRPRRPHHHRIKRGDANERIHRNDARAP